MSTVQASLTSLGTPGGFFICAPSPVSTLSHSFQHAGARAPQDPAVGFAALGPGIGTRHRVGTDMAGK